MMLLMFSKYSTTAKNLTLNSVALEECVSEIDLFKKC